ncbi:hypothetical protein TNIN_288991 [Trichonephila inaurata madagascariensis]|uniref:Uncharacterized protein n=1 Tax=Trichonephila inaurata madagascariensis TaxID=2747483 RepID=A0A8X6YKQ3_9ARAC|nr:hypothetical protein TNIN_80601 [Trichonephila inaurata madagascariensis]GFY72691.1 hypothetical protein TNIN_288991 [Trichonephila inaurata madagascariensis]
MESIFLAFLLNRFRYSKSDSSDDGTAPHSPTFRTAPLSPLRHLLYPTGLRKAPTRGRVNEKKDVDADCGELYALHSSDLDIGMRRFFFSEEYLSRVARAQSVIALGNSSQGQGEFTEDRRTQNGPYQSEIRMLEKVYPNLLEKSIKNTEEIK